MLHFSNFMVQTEFELFLSLQHVKNRQEMMHYLVKPEINGKVKHAMVRFQHSTKKNKQQENTFFWFFCYSCVQLFNKMVGDNHLHE